MGGIKKLLDWLEKIAIAGTIVTFTIMIIMGVLQVLFRYVIGSSLYFTEELARYMFIWGVFLASAVCLRRKSHAAIGLFVSWMPARVRRIVLTIASLCCILFFFIIFSKGIELTIATWGQASPALEIPMGTIYLAIPVGGFFMLLFSIENLITEINPKLAGGKAEGKGTEC
ncbi:MAG TPA: TRAP transporter small permease [Clostridia bacterium]|nr:TRAP transporter small permease [Clostridia bacterium]